MEISVHPEAEHLYVSRIDVGEPQPRTVISGLGGVVPMEQLLNRSVVVVCNLKAAKMRGIESAGMVLCASTGEAAARKVEPLDPPSGACPGDRVLVQGLPVPTAYEVLNPKKKQWDKIQVDLATSTSCEAQWRGQALVVDQQAVKCKSLADVPIK